MSPSLSTIRLLTTIFTPASSCSDVTRPTYGYCFDAGVDEPHCAIGYDQGCLPFDQFITSYQTVYFSPAVCPSGFSAAARTTVTQGTGYVATSLCCPLYVTHSSCLNLKGVHSRQQYYSSMTYSSVSDRYPGCYSTVRDHFTTGRTTTSSGDIFFQLTPTKAGTTGTFTVHMPAFQVVWASTDLESFTPRSAPLLTSFTSSPPVTSSSQQSVTSFQSSTSSRSISSHTTSPGSSNSLSTGAQAGIGVGVSIVGLVVLAILGWCLLWRKRRRRETLREISVGEASNLPTKEDPATTMQPYKDKSETSHQVGELHASGSPRSELEGSWTGRDPRQS